MSITMDVSAGAGVQQINVSAENGIALTVASAASGTTDHRQLAHRDAGNQHPISAITGLEDELTEALTNFDIFEIMQGG